MADENRTQHATLGCGTLILIALIVAFFSRPGMCDLEREVHGLRFEVRELKAAVDSESTENKALRKRIEKGKVKD
jgi:hypothetical protein